MSILLEVAANIIAIVQIHRNSFEKLVDLYFSKLVAYIPWIPWDPVIWWAILIAVQFGGSTVNGILCEKTMKIFLVS